MIPVERLDALDAAIERDEVPLAWKKEQGGRVLLSFLAHLSPVFAAQPSWGLLTSRPGDSFYYGLVEGTLDPWLAELLEWITRTGSPERRDRVLRRTAAVLRRWDALSAETRRQLDYECRAIVVREARQHVPESEERSLAAIDNVLALLDRAIAGGEVGEREWSAVEASGIAEAQALSARGGSVRARGGDIHDIRVAWQATQAAYVACERLPRAAKYAVYRAVDAAPLTLVPRPPDGTHWYFYAQCVVADRIIDQMLTAMERECAKVTT